jgi:hypothetical protein
MNARNPYKVILAGKHAEKMSFVRQLKLSQTQLMNFFQSPFLDLDINGRKFQISLHENSTDNVDAIIYFEDSENPIENFKNIENGNNYIVINYATFDRSPRACLDQIKILKETALNAKTQAINNAILINSAQMFDKTSSFNILPNDIAKLITSTLYLNSNSNIFFHCPTTKECNFIEILQQILSDKNDNFWKNQGGYYFDVIKNFKVIVNSDKLNLNELYDVAYQLMLEDYQSGNHEKSEASIFMKLISNIYLCLCPKTTPDLYEQGINQLLEMNKHISSAKVSDIGLYSNPNKTPVTTEGNEIVNSNSSRRGCIIS